MDLLTKIEAKKCTEVYNFFLIYPYFIKIGFLCVFVNGHNPGNVPLPSKPEDCIFWKSNKS